MAYGDYERRKMLEKSIADKYNFTIGLILAPSLILGPFFIIWLISKVIK